MVPPVKAAVVGGSVYRNPVRAVDAAPVLGSDVLTGNVKIY